MTPPPVNSPFLFEEDDFLPSPEYASSYVNCIRLGRERMQGTKVVIGGLARNVARYIPRLRMNIEYLGKMFSDYRVLFYENDSTDGTPQLLQKWCQEDRRIHLVSESLGDPVHLPERCLRRAERMSFYRSSCQTAIVERWGDFDNLILMDTDLEGGWSNLGIANTFGHDDWDFVGSNGIIYRRRGMKPNIPVQYDAWAYRERDDYQLMKTKEVNRLIFERGGPLVPLASCFGGLGVYRMEAFRVGKYSGGDIEHVGLHRSMRNQGFGRIYLNPSQIVVYGRRHRKWDSVISKCQKVVQGLGLQTTTWLYANPSTKGLQDSASSNLLFRKAS